MIGLIAATSQEMSAISSQMDRVSSRTLAHVEFRSGKLGGQDIVVALSGVGKVAAAIASTLMCQLYQPSCLISVGVAGGLKQEQEVGDLIISDAIIQADFDTTQFDGPEGLGLRFQANPKLIEKAQKAAQKTQLNWMVGAIATQDLFMAAKEDYERLLHNFPEAACSEMEGGAVAQTAKAFSIPCLVVRTLSDVAVHENNPMEYAQFAVESAQKVATFLEIFCQEF
ncbi:MAG: 5'-methylthioadenosine/adenosylhomocysteine nucleosidase [Allobaculum sp.]|nr:5'-methylthioadenosine/adenosylhomocysteine nucleosidase [Allobaculum sp.]